MNMHVDTTGKLQNAKTANIKFFVAVRSEP